jgi:hypothetical protein
MPIGSEEYTQADLSPHIVGHPGARASMFVGEALRNTYVAAQYDGGVIFQQPFGFNTTTLARYVRTHAPVYTSWVGIAKARRHLPDEITHVVCFFGFGTSGALAQRVSARLTITDASANVDTDTVFLNNTGDAIEDTALPISGLSQDPLRLGVTDTVSRNARYAFGVSEKLRELTIEIPLANISTSAPGLCSFYLDARVTGALDGADFSSTLTITPNFVNCWWESRP